MTHPAHTFTLIFLAAIALSLGLRLWLGLRQMAHVRGHRAAVPAEFATAISLADHQKAADYTCAKTRLGLIETAVGAALLLAFTLGGLLQVCADFAQAWFATESYAFGLALFAAVGVIGFVVDLPFGLYRTFVLEQRFGFNKMTPALFIGDMAKQLLLTVVIGGPVLLAVLWLMDRMGANWWLYVWLFFMGFNLLVLMLYPTVIAPLFNKFSPLTDEALKTRIEALLARCGFASKGLFVMDGSKRSAHGNAYFTGIGRNKRIVFFDTLLGKLAPEEVEAVLAHELGHFKHRHVVKRIVLMAALSLGFLWLLAQLMNTGWFYQGLGVGTEGTAMALVLFSQALGVFTFPFSPVMSALSRRHEYEADAYAARQASATDLVTALVKLYKDNAATLTPDPLHSTFYDSHPPASLRIARLKA
ncbi:MAG TPA: M48 family metallopeptidase [Rhodocyclaceae bacterium]|nr:M48 family metallopeptidase [Rhodocyclaceae bacterium]